METKFNLENIKTVEEKKLLERIEEIKNQVQKGAKRLQFYDDVGGIDSNPEEGTVSMKDDRNSMLLSFAPDSKDIIRFEHTRLKQKGNYIRFHREKNDNGTETEIYETGRVIDEKPVEEQVIINRETGDVVYVIN